MKRIYFNGVLLDGTREMEPKKNAQIRTENGRITEVSFGSMTKEDAEREGAQAIDLKGAYVLPGLINLHVHLPANGKPKKKASDPKKAVKLITSNGLMKKIGKKICSGYAMQELLSGVTTIRTVGGIADFDSVIRDEIRAGKLEGPRILASNMAVSVPDGHMAGSLGYEAKDAEHAKELVSLIAKDKPDLIKLMITGGVLDAKEEGEPGVLKMPPAVIEAACRRAHELGLMVAAHTESPEGVKEALKNGVDTIEHGARPDAEMLQLFKEKHAALVATLSPAISYALFDPKVTNATHMEQVNGRIVFDGIVECAKACLAEGIPVGLGTDTGCPYTTHYNMWRELVLFEKYCGVSKTEAIYTATLGNAKIAGIDSLTGSIEPGKAEDLVILREDPLRSLKAFRQPQLVAAAGRLYYNPKIKRMQQVEDELDHVM